jgi:hypothetical protein
MIGRNRVVSAPGMARFASLGHVSDALVRPGPFDRRARLVPLPLALHVWQAAVAVPDHELVGDGLGPPLGAETLGLGSGLHELPVEAAAAGQEQRRHLEALGQPAAASEAPAAVPQSQRKGPPNGVDQAP